MKTTTFHIYLCLLSLTIGAYILSTVFPGEKNVLAALVLIAWAIKFLLVAFQFMELKKAHLFWKLSLSLYLLIVVSAVVLMIGPL